MHEAFTAPQKIVHGVKAKIESLVIHGRRLYAGHASGAISIYLLSSNPSRDKEATLQLTASPCGDKSINQLGVIKETNSLIVLSSDGQLTLLDLHSLSIQSCLQQTKGQANIFALDSAVQSSNTLRGGAPLGTPGIPILVTHLAVACRRRLLLFQWKDSQWVEPREVALPHQIRSMTFTSAHTLVIGYSDASYGTLDIKEARLSELFPSSTTSDSLPLLASIADQQKPSAGLTMGLGSLGGLAAKTGGYMGIAGMGRVAKNQVLSTGKGEVVIQREAMAIFIPSDGQVTQAQVRTIEYPSPPTEMVICFPYILALLATPTKDSQAALHVHSLQTLNCVQTVPLLDNFHALLTPTIPSKAPLAYCSSSVANAGTKQAVEYDIHLISLTPWTAQLDEMTSHGSYEEALSLLETVEDIILPDKPERRVKLRALQGVSQFLKGEYDAAIDLFIELDVNPAKVICLYPERISGKLYKDGYHREHVFGGRTEAQVRRAMTTTVGDDEDKKDDGLPTSGSPMRKRWSTGRPPKLKSTREEDSASIRSSSSGKTSTPNEPDSEVQFRRSVEVLLRYLADCRQRINKALAQLSPSSRPSPLTSTSTGTVEELLELPDVPFTKLNPTQIQYVAQVVDTTLFRCYLAIRPTLLGPLCRIENWCEVEQVEVLLKEAKKYRELLNLYHGKNNHKKALELLTTMSEDEQDPKAKVEPTIEYLHKLGPQHLDLIFSASEWVFKMDPTAGLGIFTADLEEVENLPRHAVAKYLEKFGPDVCKVYLLHIIERLGEGSPEFHEKLAQIYLQEARAKSKDTDVDSYTSYVVFLDFLQTSHQYRPDRILGRLHTDECPKARAILLGRLGQDQAALSIYVKLEDYSTAEAYCQQVYKGHPDERGIIFQTLLKLYLDASNNQQPLFAQAADLLAKHGARIDPEDVLDLLPPLVTLEDLNRFLYDAIAKQVSRRNDGKLHRSVLRSHLDHLQEADVLLKSNYVKVTDSQLCPLCHKRIGNSVLAVHMPNGMVTHFQCRTQKR